MKFEKIYIELSDICGLDCFFCTGAKNVRGMMSVERFKSLLPKLKNRAKIYTFHLLGDPLILKDLSAYISLAKAYEMRLEITTSGFYMNEKNIQILLENENIHQINISLMAFLAQRKTSLNDYFKGISRLLTRHMKSKNESFINLRLWNLNDKFEPPPENAEIYALLEKFFKCKIDKSAAKTRLERKIFLHQARLFKWAGLESENSRQTGTCHALSKQLGILSDGTLVPCCIDSAGIINLGNLFAQSLDEILQSPRARAMIQGFKQNKLTEALCQKCEFYKARSMPE